MFIFTFAQRVFSNRQSGKSQKLCEMSGSQFGRLPINKVKARFRVVVNDVEVSKLQIQLVPIIYKKILLDL